MFEWKMKTNMKETCPFDTVQRHEREIAELKEEYRKLWLIFSTHTHCGNDIHFIDHNNNVKTIITTPTREEEIDFIETLVPPERRFKPIWSFYWHVDGCSATNSCVCDEWLLKPKNKQIVCEYLKNKGLK